MNSAARDRLISLSGTAWTWLRRRRRRASGDVGGGEVPEKIAPVLEAGGQIGGEEFLSGPGPGLAVARAWGHSNPGRRF